MYITLVILRGRLHVVYSIYSQRGVHQIVSGPSAQNLADGKWHRIVIGLDRRGKRIHAFLDTYPPEVSSRLFNLLDLRTISLVSVGMNI